MSLHFKNLASGSSGNATLVQASDGLHTTRLLVDCGLAPRRLALRLGAAGVQPQDIDAIFITHEHADHASSAVAWALKHRTPVWMSRGTHTALGAPVLGDLLHVARDGCPIALGALCVQPFTVPHDAREPLQLTCTDGAHTLGMATDLGHASAHALAALQGCHALFIEANHEPALLAASAYPAFLKERVAGPLGHLSNAACAALLQKLRHAALGHVVAAHLSVRNNAAHLARAALAAALGRSASDIHVAHESEGSAWLQAA